MENVNEVEGELAALRRQNDLLGRLLEQAIRMGERVLAPAREVVDAYREHVRMARVSLEAAQPAADRLAQAVDDLSRLVGDPVTRDRTTPAGQEAKRRASRDKKASP